MLTDSSDHRTQRSEMRELAPRRKIHGDLTLPGDKSISHRAALFSLLLDGPLTIRNYSDGEDCQSTLKAVSALGAEVTDSVADGDSCILTITPPQSVKTPGASIDCGNSGTTARLLLGLLSGLDVAVELTGDESLSRRPMERVTDPLSVMGASFSATNGGLPLRALGGAHGSIDFRPKTPSAQVKSALLLAACAGGGTAIVTEDVITRDHTERMLQNFGANVRVSSPRVGLSEDPLDPRKKIRHRLDNWKARVAVTGNATLSANEIDVPGDFSTAAFFFACAAIGRGTVTIRNLGLNPTRTAFLEHLKAVGCEVTIENRVTISEEPRGTVRVTGVDLKGRKISGRVATGMIDEIPIVAVMACFAEGTTVIRDVGELRVKETDRLETIAVNLRKMGAAVGVVEDGLVIEAKGEMQPADFDSFGDHRIAMAMSVAALFLPGKSTLVNDEVTAISCPRFFELLQSISHS